MELTNRELTAKYVTKNAAPRAVYEQKLTGVFTKSRITSLFTGSGATLRLSRTHRRAHRRRGSPPDGKIRHVRQLGRKPNRRANSFCKNLRVFYRQSQRVTFKDIGGKKQIHQWAEAANASITELGLTSQFRCNGSDGYIAWIDNTLGIKQTANPTFDGIDSTSAFAIHQMTCGAGS